MFKNFLISQEDSLKDALKLITKNGCKTVVVVKKNTFLGTLSDGDIRKAVLNKNNLNKKIIKFYNRNSIFLKKNSYTSTEAQKIFLKNNLDLIPVIDNQKNLYKILTWKEIFNTERKIKKIQIPVIIMAGGLGKRLLPVTSVLPKPLIPIKGKPVIDYILENFKNGGFYKFNFVINYFSQIVKAYLIGNKYDKNFNFFTEKIPLGTIGGIRLLRFKEKNVLVSNCDVVFKVDYADFVKFHTSNKNDITIAGSHKNIIIPYGVCHLNSLGNLSQIDEKPSFDLLVNSGLYLIKKEVISLIPKNQKVEFTDFIKTCLKLNKKIGVYPILENQWIDMGQWNEYQKAVENL